ncbi:MAG TPA: STAS domain-containing protein [Candidatus Polarisedimenticolaceae bacterium]
MFEIRQSEEGVIALSGRLDASHAARLEETLDAVQGPATLDLAGLEYVSSLGLGALLKTQKRLMGRGAGLRLRGLSPHLREVFRFSGFDRIFEIEGA